MGWASSKPLGDSDLRGDYLKIEDYINIWADHKRNDLENFDIMDKIGLTNFNRNLGSLIKMKNFLLLRLIFLIKS